MVLASGFRFQAWRIGTRGSRKSMKSKGAVEVASAKGADSTKSPTFGLLWGRTDPGFGASG